MATVWRARDQVLARSVAVKILHEHLADDAAFLERFRREAVAAAGLTHPHVVAIYDTGEMEEPGSRCHYIVMEHCGGGTLGQLLKADGPFRPERVAGIGATICDALAYAHSRSIIHRDVKPANVLIGDDGLLKVGDFGIAKAVTTDNDITTTGKILGTVAYISPEYATDQALDARSDIYSLGVVLYELAVGRVPFHESTNVATAMRHVNDAPPPLRSIRAGIPKSLENIILKALQKEPDRRFATADEMRESLENLAPGASRASVVTSATRAVPASAPSTFRNESKWIVPVLSLIAGAIILAALASAIFDTGDSTKKPPAVDVSGSAPIEIDSVADFDPEFDGSEDPSGLPEAIDGDPATSWKTDSYVNPLHTYKSGVGILLDLGTEQDVTTVTIATQTPGLDIELLAGDSVPTAASDLEVIDSLEGVPQTFEFEAGVSARYWVVWITDLPGGAGGIGSIAEVKFFGR